MLKPTVNNSGASKGPTRKSPYQKVPKYTEKDEEILRSLNEQLNFQTDYTPWSRKRSSVHVNELKKSISSIQEQVNQSIIVPTVPTAAASVFKRPVTTGRPSSTSTNYSKERARRIKAEQHDGYRDKIKMLEMRISNRRTSIKSFTQREQELIQTNSKLAEEIQNQEEFTAEDVTEKLRNYAKCRVGAHNLGAMYNTQTQEAENVLHALKSQLSTKITDLENFIQGYNDVLRKTQYDLFSLQTYKDKEYIVKLKKIAALEQWLNCYEDEHEDDLEELKQIMSKQLKKYGTDLDTVRHDAYTTSSTKFIENIDPRITTLTEINATLQREIVSQTTAEGNLRKQIQILEKEIEELKQKPSTDFKSFLYPHIYPSQPQQKFTTDNDMKLDIPLIKWLPI